MAEEYFGGEVELDVVDQDFVKVGIPAESEYDLNPEEAADWIVTHLDAIQERYAEINRIDTSDPKSNLGRWIAEETGQIQTNR